MTNEIVLNIVKDKRDNWYNMKVKRDKIIGHAIA